MAFTPKQLRKAIRDWEARTGKRSTLRIVSAKESSLFKGRKQAVIPKHPKKRDNA